MSSVTTGLFGSGDMRVEPAAARHRDSSALDPYRPWLMAAAIYNLVAGAAVLFLPPPYFLLFPIPPPPPPPPPPGGGGVLVFFFPRDLWGAREPVPPRPLPRCAVLRT